MRLRASVLVLVACLFWLGDGVSHVPVTDSGLSYPQQNTSRDTAYPVLKVIDGDTIKIEYGGKSETVTLIGVDTPETVHPNKPVEPFGPEASSFLENMLKGESVYLRFGNDERGKYGRLLAYVYHAPDAMFVNLEIVRQGYGRSYRQFPHKHLEIFNNFEKKAREVRKGLWAGESARINSDATSVSVPTTDVDGDMTVYVTKSGKKYHLESCRWGNKPISLAKARGSYTACARCNPPK